MHNGPKIAQVAALIGDPSRANILIGLMDGQALTASELAYISGVSAQTASGHLAKLKEAGLLTGEKQGRHRYFRLASPQVSQMLEGLMVVAQAGPARAAPTWRGGEELRNARTCYDHMAGRVAVAIADRLIADGRVELDDDGGKVTEAGYEFLARLGIDLSAKARRRVFCRPCLDWSERRPHLAGVVGAALLDHALKEGWVERLKDSRALAVTPSGVAGFTTIYCVEVAI